MALLLPYADFPISPYPQTDIWLIDSKTMGEITPLSVHDKQLQLQLDNQSSFTGWIHLLDETADAIIDHQTAIRYDRDGETIYSGAVWMIEEESSASGVGQQSGDDQCQITSYGWFNCLGGSGGMTTNNGRLVHTGAEFQAMMYVNGTDSSDGLMPNYQAWIDQNGGNDYVQLGIDEATTLAYDAVEYPQTSDAAIIFDLLARANIDSPTYISQGNVYGTPQQRNLTLNRMQVIGEEIMQLVNTEGGVDWIIDPVTRRMDLYGVGASTSSKIPSGYGQDRGQGCLFTYPGNCISAQRTIDGTQTQNRVEVVGEYAIGRQDDLGSQQMNGLLEAMDSLSEVVDPNILAAYAAAEISVRAQPWTVVTMTPRGLMPSDGTRSGVPQPFRDYELGDIGYARVDRGRFQVGTAQTPEAVRIFGFTLNCDDDGLEKVSQIQVNYTSLGSGGS